MGHQLTDFGFSVFLSSARTFVKRAVGDHAPSALIVALSMPLAGRPVFRLDDNVFGSPGMADLVSAAAAVDRMGPLPLVHHVAAGPGGGRVLELAASRTAVGTVSSAAQSAGSGPL